MFLQLQHPLHLSRKKLKCHLPCHSQMDTRPIMTTKMFRRQSLQQDIPHLLRTHQQPLLQFKTCLLKITPPRPMQATDQHKSASKCPSPVAPRRSSRLRRPRQLISMSMRGKYHDQACRPCPTSVCDQDVGHSGEGGM